MYLSATTYSPFSLHAYITKMVNCQSQLSPRRVISRITFLSSVSKVITHALEKLNQQIKTVYIVSNGYDSQFRLRYVFSPFKHIKPDITIEWHYKEAYHGKDMMVRIGGTVKNLVYRRVLSEDELSTLFGNSQNLKIKSTASIVCSSTNQNLFKSQSKDQKTRQYCQCWNFTRLVVFVMVYTHFPIIIFRWVKIWSRFTYKNMAYNAYTV